MTFLDIARDLAAVRKEWATEFLYLRQFHAKTDAQAKAGADEKYIERLTLAEARYEISKIVLAKSASGARVQDIQRQIEESYDDPHPNSDQEPGSGEAEADTDEPGQDCGD